jgi:hypothetical protein
MSSEPDSTPRRRPPTIDLTATEIDAGQPAPDAQAQAAADNGGDGAGGDEPRHRKSRVGVMPVAIGAGAGALAVAGIAVGLWFAGLVPSNNAAPIANGPPTSGTGNAQLSQKLDQIRTELASRQPETALTARLATVEAQTKVLNDSLVAINRRLDEIAVAARTALERANEASQAAKGATRSAVQRSDLDALSSRIASLESMVKTLSTNLAQRPAPSADDRRARAALAAEALRATVERGAPYPSELAAVKALGTGANATAPLEPFAAGGVPTAAALAHELSQLVPALEKAALVTSNDGSFLGRLETHAKGLVRITPIDAPDSDRPEAVIERIRRDIARADTGAAAADIARLPPAAKALAEPWLQKAHARDAAVAASRAIVAAALAGLTTANTQ